MEVQTPTRLASLEMASQSWLPKMTQVRTMGGPAPLPIWRYVNCSIRIVLSRMHAFQHEKKESLDTRHLELEEGFVDDDWFDEVEDDENHGVAEHDVPGIRKHHMGADKKLNPADDRSSIGPQTEVR